MGPESTRVRVALNPYRALFLLQPSEHRQVFQRAVLWEVKSSQCLVVRGQPKAVQGPGMARHV